MDPAAIAERASTAVIRFPGTPRPNRCVRPGSNHSGYSSECLKSAGRKTQLEILIPAGAPMRFWDSYMRPADGELEIDPAPDRLRRPG